MDNLDQLRTDLDRRDALEADLREALLPILKRYGVNLEVTVVPVPEQARKAVSFRR